MVPSGSENPSVALPDIHQIYTELSSGSVFDSFSNNISSNLILFFTRTSFLALCKHYLSIVRVSAFSL